MQTVRILGLPFPVWGRRDYILAVHRLIAAKRGARIFTPNAEMVARAARDADFFAVLRRADLLIPDGVGISLAAAKQGVSLSRLPGIELAEAVLSTAPRPYRVFFFGARPGVAREAAEALSSRYPRTEIAGVQDGYFPRERSHTVAAAIAGVRPDLLFVCLGSPRQEEWIDAHALPCPAIGLGGAFDVWAGRVKRAPIGARQLGLEWLWRTVREPRRLLRLPALASFALRTMTEGRVNCEKKSP